MLFFYLHLYVDCPYAHSGDIAIFSDNNFQKTDFLVEIEKYPEFKVNKIFDHLLLKEVVNLEKDKKAVVEMNRLLKIIMSLIAVTKDKIAVKINQIVADASTENNLEKPPLALHFWGPKNLDIDVAKDTDATQSYSDGMFHTFTHS